LEKISQELLDQKLKQELSEKSPGSYEIDVVMVPIGNFKKGTLFKGAYIKRPSTRIVNVQ